MQRPDPAPLVAAILLATCAPVHAHADPPAPSVSPPPDAAPPAIPLNDPQRVERWSADLRMLLGELPGRHPDPFHAVTEAEWRAAAADLALRIPTLDDAQVYFAMLRLVAMLGDSHTMLGAAPNITLHQLPFVFGWFDDGVFVAAATPEHEGLLGARLVRVGAMPIEAVMDRVASCIAHENDSVLRNGATQYLRIPEALAAAGVCPMEGDGAVAMALERPDGEQVVGEFSAIDAAQRPRWRTLPDWQHAGAPISMKNRRANY